jgi:hypothetical protein
MAAIAVYLLLLCGCISAGLGLSLSAAVVCFCLTAPLALLIFGGGILEPCLYLSLVLGLGYHALILYKTQPR